MLASASVSLLCGISGRDVIYLAFEYILYISFSIGICFGRRNSEAPAIANTCSLPAIEMKLTTSQIILLFSVLMLTTSCSGQSLSGKWKLQQVDLIDVPSQTKKFTIDLTKPDKMKALLYEANISKEDMKVDSLSVFDDNENDMDTTLDVNAMKADIDKYIAASLNTSMTLKSDNKFYMRSNCKLPLF